MAKTNSWAFPNLINVAQNQVAIIEDDQSVTNRTRLLFLTEPTEIYNEPNQGVGLKRFLWHYNNEKVQGLIQKKMVDQLELHEPQCNPENTQFVDGNVFTGLTQKTTQKYNRLEMTVSVETKFGKFVDVSLGVQEVDNS